jgi:SAM-dependent methyltransferase
MPPADHFSACAPAYARSRPGYPRRLIEALAGLCPAQGTAWDCGTGNGQAALLLAEAFEAVVATDISAAQLQEAPRHPRVRYRLSGESDSGLPAAGVDLVTAAQAAHWFDLPAFHAEVRRVLRPGGIVALWGYGLCHIAPAIDEIIREFYSGAVGPYWPAERGHLESGYRDLTFPFPELPFPDVAMELDWTLADLAAYVGTWSAVSRYRAGRGEDPMPAFVARIAAAWGSPHQARRVTWPLFGRIGRV